MTVAAGAEFGDFVHVGAESSIGSASIGAFVDIGARVRVADGVRIEG